MLTRIAVVVLRGLACTSAISNVVGVSADWLNAGGVHRVPIRAMHENARVIGADLLSQGGVVSRRSTGEKS